MRTVAAYYVFVWLAVTVQDADGLTPFHAAAKVGAAAVLDMYSHLVLPSVNSAGCDMRDGKVSPCARELNRSCPCSCAKNRNAPLCLWGGCGVVVGWLWGGVGGIPGSAAGLSRSCGDSVHLCAVWGFACPTFSAARRAARVCWWRFKVLSQPASTGS